MFPEQDKTGSHRVLSRSFSFPRDYNELVLYCLQGSEDRSPHNIAVQNEFLSLDYSREQIMAPTAVI